MLKVTVALVGISSLLICLLVLWQVIGAADEVIDSIDRDELAKYLSQKSVPEGEEEEVFTLFSTFIDMLT